MRLCLLLTVMIPASLVAQSVPPGARDLAAKVQAHYSTVKTFTADFSLTEQSALRQSALTDRGTLKVKKPLKMRFTSTMGDKNQFISDGVMTYLVQTKDRYVEVASLPKEGDAPTWILLLAGRGDLTRDFVASLPADQPPTEWRLTLKPPANRPADFQSMTLEVDRATYQLRGLTVVTDQGSSSRYRFTNMRENTAVSDREFVFENPKGFALKYQ
jgi:outer membrane lipoprotein-sorting protein